MEKEFIPNYLVKKLGKKYLLTSKHGCWEILDKKSYDALMKRKLSNKLSLKLERKGLILTKENIKKITFNYRKKYLFLFQGTSLHIVIPTLRCDMKCVYCHASSKNPKQKKYDMKKDTAKKVVDFVFQSPTKAITIEFQGGEPLLNYEIVKFIINYAREKNKEAEKDLRFALVTNLNLMDEKKLKFLIKNNVGICTSLDGPKELHDYNRRMFGKKSNYDNVVKWIKKINKEYKRNKSNSRAGALVTITRESLKYPKEIVDEYVKNGLDRIHLRFLNGLGIAKKAWGNIGYKAEEFIKFWKKAVDYILELNLNGIRIREKTLDIFASKILKGVDPGYLDLRSPCGAAIGQLVYNYNGDIYTCDEGRMVGEDIFKLGNVKKDNYKDVLSSDQTCAIVASSINDIFCSSCVYQPYCGLCPVCNYEEQGNIISKVKETMRCKIFEKQFDYFFEKIIMNKKILNTLFPSK